MCQMLAKFLGLSKGPLSTSQFLILKLPLPVTLFTSFTSVVFRDRGIVMSQSLLFSQPITNSLANRCRSASNSATKPQNLKIIIISNRVLYFSLFIYCQVLQSLLASSCGMTRKQQLKHWYYWLHNRTNLTLNGTCNLLLIALKCDNIIANGWLLDCCYFVLRILFSMLSKS